MTGRDLILYILKNNLEDEPVFQDGKFIGFMTVGEAAVKMNVGPATIRSLADMHWLDSIKIGDEIFIADDFDTKGAKNNG